MIQGQSEGNPTKKKKSGIAQRVYLVFLRSNISRTDQPHERLLGAKLTRAGAEAIMDLNPGSYIHKVEAYKT